MDPKLKIISLVDRIGSQQRVADLIKSETGFSMPQSTISRLYRGEGKPAMFALVVYVLEIAVSNVHKEKTRRTLIDATEKEDVEQTDFNKRIVMKFKTATLGAYSDAQCNQFIERFNDVLNTMTLNMDPDFSLQIERDFFDEIINFGESCYLNLRLMRVVGRRVLASY